MNKLELVGKEVAELAFHLGFNWKTDNDYYYVEGESMPKYFQYVTKKEQLVLIPQQYLLQKWLRELHDLHIIINCYLKDGTSHFDYIIQELQTFKQIVHAGDSGSYEETLEYAINRCLLIVKDKNGNKTE